VEPRLRIVVRPYGSPIPLGFFAFGIGMFMYAALDVGWVKPADQLTVGLLLAIFVAPLQLIATVFAFLGRDVGAATALGLFAGSWLAGGVLLATGKPGVLNAAFGFFLIAFTILIGALAVSSLLGKPLLSLFLAVSSCRGVFGAVYELGGGHGWLRASGWAALAAFVIAVYGGLAFLLEDLAGRTILPLLRRGGAREAIEHDLDAQFAGIADEAGVRHTL